LSKFTAFWSIVTFSPILLTASMVLTSKFYRVGLVGSLLEHELIRSTIHYLLPFFLIFGVIFFAYRVPNTPISTGFTECWVPFRLSFSGSISHG
jgi:hypothetical protein